MKLQLETANPKNPIFYSKITKNCIVCNSNKIFANKFGVLCQNCGALLDFESKNVPNLGTKF